MITPPAPGRAQAAGSRLVLLGTCGGPWPAPGRSGIAQAVVVGDEAYLVDCGTGVAGQLVRTGLLRRLRAVFVTHLHSDHVCDFFNLFLLGWPVFEPRTTPIPAFGPGPAGGARALPPDPPGRAVPVIAPACPTPGLAAMAEAQLQAHAYDLNVRMRDENKPDLRNLFAVHEIALPGALGALPRTALAPDMAPVVVTEDDHVRVSAILVDHPPVFPAFAFRFDTDRGSITISGDTKPCQNLLRLARGSDVLVHEVFDRELMRDAMGGTPALAARLRHLSATHTPVDEVGEVAAAAGVGTLVLTHLIPPWLPDPRLCDERWARQAQDGFDGTVIVGRDLLEVEL